MSQVYVCDRCDERIPDEETGGHVTTASERFDLCVPCWLAFRRWLENEDAKE